MRKSSKKDSHCGHCNKGQTYTTIPETKQAVAGIPADLRKRVSKADFKGSFDIHIRGCAEGFDFSNQAAGRQCISAEASYRRVRVDISRTYMRGDELIHTEKSNLYYPLFAHARDAVKYHFRRAQEAKKPEK